MQEPTELEGNAERPAEGQPNGNEKRAAWWRSLSTEELDSLIVAAFEKARREAVEDPVDADELRHAIKQNLATHYKRPGREHLPPGSLTVIDLIALIDAPGSLEARERVRRSVLRCVDAGAVCEGPAFGDGERVFSVAPREMGAPPATASPSEVETQQEKHYLGRAILCVIDHPEWSDAMIAAESKVHPSTLSRNERYKKTAAIFRDQGATVRRGSKDPETRAVEAEDE